MKKLLEVNADNRVVNSFLEEYKDKLDEVCSFLLSLSTIMDDQAVKLIVDLVSRNDNALAKNTIIALKPLGRSSIGGFLAAQIDDDDDDDSAGSDALDDNSADDIEAIFLRDWMTSVAPVAGNCHDPRFYFVDVVTAAPSSAERTTTFMISTTAGVSATLILQHLIYLIGYIAKRERVTALVFPSGKGDTASNGPDFLDVDFSDMLESTGASLPLIEFEGLKLTGVQLACVAASAAGIKFTKCTIPRNDDGDNDLLEAIAAIKTGGHPASIVLNETVLLAGSYEVVNDKVVKEKAKESAMRARALQVLTGLARDGKVRSITFNYSFKSRKELKALKNLYEAMMETDGELLLGPYAEADCRGFFWKNGNIKKYLNGTQDLGPWIAPHTKANNKPCKVCKEEKLCHLHEHHFDYE